MTSVDYILNAKCTKYVNSLNNLTMKIDCYKSSIGYNLRIIKINMTLNANSMK